MGEDLINVLDTLRVKTVIGLGDGAGANILLRFEMMHHTRCMGVLLINPTANATGIKEKFTVSSVPPKTQFFDRRVPGWGRTGRERPLKGGNFPSSYPRVE